MWWENNNTPMEYTKQNRKIVNNTLSWNIYNLYAITYISNSLQQIQGSMKLANIHYNHHQPVGFH